MKPYEIVRRAIHRQQPPRLPVRCGSLGCNDMTVLPVKPPLGWEPPRPGEDEWGCVWGHTEVKNMGQVVKHPFADGLPSNLRTTAWPDYGIDSRYRDCEAALAQAEREGQYVHADIFMVLFERMHSLYGFENTLCGVLVEREAMERLADHIVETHLRFVENISHRFGSRIHGVTMSDDWGTQSAAFVSAELWMDFFYPKYKRLFDAMHSAGYDVWVHSCGKVNEIVECYIRAGVDVVNLQQPRALGIEEMGKRYRGRIAFQSLCDIQHTLPTGDRQRVDADVDALMMHWADREGGFICSDYGEEVLGVKDPSLKTHMYRRFSQWSEKLYGSPLPEPKIPPPVLA